MSVATNIPVRIMTGFVVQDHQNNESVNVYVTKEKEFEMTEKASNQ